MKKIKLNICSTGDPTSRGTWSGTPFNLYNELLKKDSLATPFDSRAYSSGAMKKLIDLLSYIYYFGSSDVSRGFLHRYLNSYKVKKETQKSEVQRTLHTGTFSLPFYKLPENQQHYLFCDATWNLWSSYSTAMDGYSKKMLREAEKLERKSYSQMQHLFPISEYVKKNLVEYYGIDPEKITVVGTGLGVIQPYYGEKNYSNGKILFAAKGRFEDKGGHLVLDAFKIALKRNPTLELTIVGQNEYTEKINLPHVKAHGFLSIEELQGIFNEHSLFLMPAINEPWGLVYLEALACKMPIVGLNRNSFPELSGYGKYGFGLDEPNPEKLAELLLISFENPEKLAETGRNAQAHCLNKFSWENTVATILQTIERIEK